MKTLPLSILFAAALLASCKSTKQKSSPVAKDNEPVIQLDTITVGSKTPATQEIYRASNARSNDIIHTKLQVDFDWTASKMKGIATIELKPYFYPVTKLYLNARGMDINKVEVLENVSMTEVKKVQGKSQTEIVDILKKIPTASYKYENDSIKIDLGREFKSSENYFVVVEYVSKPNELKVGGSNAIQEDKGLYFINPSGENPFKMPQIWTQGETQSSSVWFPTIDSPNERMTQEIYMTVDEKFTTLSNGTLVDSEKLEGGRRIDHWKLDQPHAPYLAMMAVGEFKKVLGEPWNGKEVSYYVEKQFEPYAAEIFGDTREMIDFYSKRLGVPYEWPKYAQIVARDYVSGAMENTSATLHGDFMVYQTHREMVDQKKGNSVIAHELFHQWFGDLVTCESWSNLPLNESFATYGEYLWEEYKNGREAADAHAWASRQGYMQSDKEANLIRFSYNDKEDMFDGISYNKGGQVLHMLRKAVGDDAFFASLKKYLETNKFKAVEIHNLRLAFEEVTGRDMNWFFNEWFLNKGRPKLKVSSEQTQAGTILLTVEQNQDFTKAPLYVLPLEVDLYVDGKAQRKHIEIRQQKETFTLTASGKVQLVNFDAERQLLCDLSYKKSIDEYKFQYANAPLFGDRLESLRSMELLMSDQSVFELFSNAAKNDKSSDIRLYAISKLERAGTDRAAELKTILTSIFQNDKKTLVRARALSIINKKFSSDADVRSLNENALGEQSYAICSEALVSLSKVDAKAAMQKAKGFEKETGRDILFAVASVYAENGGDDQMVFFHDVIRHFSGFDLMSYCSLYSKISKKYTESGDAITAAQDFELIGKGANRFVKYTATKALKDLQGVWETKVSDTKAQVETLKKEGKDPSEAEKKAKETLETKDIITKHYEKVK